MESGIARVLRVREPSVDFGRAYNGRAKNPLPRKPGTAASPRRTDGCGLKTRVSAGRSRNNDGREPRSTRYALPLYAWRNKSKFGMPLLYRPAKMSKIPPSSDKRDIFSP